MICRFANRKLPPHSTCHRSWQLPVSRCLGKTAWKFHKCCTACPLGLPNSPNSLPKPGSANCCQVIWILSEIFWHTYSDIFWSYSAGIGVLRSKPEQILSTIVYVRITACHTEREREQVKRQYFARLQLAHHHRQRRRGRLAAKRNIYPILLSHVWI